MRDVVRMRGDHAIAIILVLGLHSFARSALNIEEAGIKIVYPPGHRTQTIKWALADFGIEKYGGQLLGNVFYPTEDTSFYSANVKPPKCVPTDAQYGCTLFSKCTGFSLPRNDGNQIIMLLDRGPARTEDPCYFVKKVYYAQQAGADAVLVVNDVAGADLSTAIAPDEEVFAKMAEDITISAGLISKEDGDIIKDMLKSGNAVTLLLNWTSALPQKAKVSWELWSNSNDECGTLCDEQLAFVRDMKATAKKLQDSGLATFSPHYILFACPAQYLDTPECQSQCIMKGAFCAQDPDGSVAEGYAGLDVLKINMMQLCFFQVANTSGQPDLWWDYVDMFGRNCTMKDKQYTEECARRVFVSVGGPALSMNTGLTLWEQCIPNVTALAQNTTARVPLLEQEQALQRGSDSMNPVSIMPTVRINGVQYRGKHDAASVTRAICAAFPTGSEPALCNDRAVSDNECLVDAIGYRRCRVRTSRAVNSCNNTFSGSGYKCVCGKGYKRGTDDLSGGETCDDENECINHSYIPRPGGPTEKPACSCSRCACINTEGGFNCTGPLPNKCTAEYNFNGCWRDPVLNIHACHDDLEQYRALAADGDLTESSTWASCKCPSCTTGDGVSSCNYCKGTCLPDSGTCISDQPTPQKGGSGGVGGVGVFFIVMLSITLTGGALFAAYRFALKGQMNNEIRSIMAQYMPLSSMDGPTSSHRPAAGGVFDEFDTNMRERVPLMQQPKASGLMNNGNRNQTYRPPTLDTALTTAAAESNSSGDQQHASWSTGASAGASDPLSPPGTFITVTPMATGAEPARSSMINDSNTAKQVTTTSPAPRPPAPDFMDALPPRS